MWGATMTEYIEREKIGLTDSEIAMCNGDYKEAFKMLLEKIESIHAANVRPVVQGEWQFHMFTANSWGYECRVCHTTWDAPTNFCPNCGADMRNLQSDSAKANNSEVIANNGEEEKT